MDDNQPLRTRRSPGNDAEEQPQKMSSSEQQLILEAAFSAVCDNIMSSQMHGNTDMWLQLTIDDKLLQFASFLSHMRKDYRLGAIVGVYCLFKSSASGNDINAMGTGEQMDRYSENILGSYGTDRLYDAMENDEGRIG